MGKAGSAGSLANKATLAQALCSNFIVLERGFLQKLRSQCFKGVARMRHSCLLLNPSCQPAPTQRSSFRLGFPTRFIAAFPDHSVCSGRAWRLPRRRHCGGVEQNDPPQAPQLVPSSHSSWRAGPLPLKKHKTRYLLCAGSQARLMALLCVLVNEE